MNVQKEKQWVCTTKSPVGLKKRKETVNIKKKKKILSDNRNEETVLHGITFRT